MVEKTKKYVECSCCKEEIYYETDFEEQDPCYQIDGNLLCEDCIKEYVEEHCFVSLVEE